MSPSLSFHENLLCLLFPKEFREQDMDFSILVPLTLPTPQFVLQDAWWAAKGGQLVIEISISTEQQAMCRDHQQQPWI
jgi:hypothetical protein